MFESIIFFQQVSFLPAEENKNQTASYVDIRLHYFIICNANQKIKLMIKWVKQEQLVATSSIQYNMLDFDRNIVKKGQ